MWVDPERIKIIMPTDFQLPPGGLGIRNPDPPMEAEKRLHGPKMAAVKAFVRANGFDRTVIDPPRARIGIMTTGKAYLDTRQALEDLGISDERAKALGIRLYKVGMTWPLEPEGARRFAEGLQEVIVIEEKRSNLEEQLVHLLYNMPAGRRPLVIGKSDETGAIILPSEGELTPTGAVMVIAGRLMKHTGKSPSSSSVFARLEAKEKLLAAPPAKAAREPYFCAGCPHSISTRVPEGSRASTGIGCHMMVIGLPERATATFTQMGGEGVAWTGMAPFTDEKHIFVNMGDGTYFHSGLLAIRAAAAAGVNATYKVLFNDAVAMTGGQPHDGELTVPALVRQLLAEGLKRVEVVAEDPDRWVGKLPAEVTISHRDELDAVQRRLREIPGVTALVFDQVCAAEKRRRRKRGKMELPPRRAFINDAVCEGCGDCSAVSNCIAVEPLDTPFGRKRQINQSSCNTDLSCIKGFCPSFVTVEGVEPRKARREPAMPLSVETTEIPLPVLPELGRSYAMLLAGIGGTGVITVSAILAQAAHLDGNAVLALDQTGLAQKNGAVLSHIRIAGRPDELSTVRIGLGQADLILGFDLVTAAGPGALLGAAAGHTKAVVDRHVVPTAAFVKDNAVDLKAETLLRIIGRAIDAEAAVLDATGLATGLIGDAIAANMLLLGFAWQRGLVPVSLDALMTAIELNGVAVAMNRSAFALGRLAAHNIAAVQTAAKPTLRTEKSVARTLPEIVAKRVELLTAYQDAAYAERYRAFVDKVRGGREGQGAGSPRARRGGRQVALQADGLQGRVRGRPPLQRRRVPEEARKPVRRRLQAPPSISRRRCVSDRDPQTGQLKKKELRRLGDADCSASSPH